MTMEMVSVGAASPDAGRSTVSTAKKQPAMAALKPAREQALWIDGTHQQATKIGVGPTLPCSEKPFHTRMSAL